MSQGRWITENRKEPTRATRNRHADPTAEDITGEPKLPDILNSYHPLRISLDATHPGNVKDANQTRANDCKTQNDHNAFDAPIANVRDRLIKIETRMGSLATKEDLANIRGDILAAMTSQTWKMITWTSLIGAAVIGAAFTVARMPN